MNAKKEFIISIFVLLTYLQGTAQPHLQKIVIEEEINCIDEPYKMVFYDGFDKEELDVSAWYSYIPYGPEEALDSCSFCRTGGTVGVYKSENVSVKEGNLMLKMDSEKVEWFGETYDFSTAIVFSKQVYNTYGKYEARLKLPKGKQQWPAFWVFGWSTEIDIFEFICYGPNKPIFSLHSWVEEGCKNKKNLKKGRACYTNNSKHVDFGIDFSEDFHTFSVEYEPTMIKYYIDDIMVRFTPKYYDRKKRPITSCHIPPGKYYVDLAFPNRPEPVQVIVNQAACSVQREPNPIYPNYMEVDYVKVFQKQIQPGLKEVKLY